MLLQPLAGSLAAHAIRQAMRHRTVTKPKPTANHRAIVCHYRAVAKHLFCEGQGKAGALPARHDRTSCLPRACRTFALLGWHMGKRCKLDFHAATTRATGNPIGSIHLLARPFTKPNRTLHPPCSLVTLGRSMRMAVANGSGTPPSPAGKPTSKATARCALALARVSVCTAAAGVVQEPASVGTTRADPTNL